MPSTTLTISTAREKQVLDITDRIEPVIDNAGIEDGLCHIFVAHTTACVTAGESIEDTDLDLMPCR